MGGEGGGLKRGGAWRGEGGTFSVLSLDMSLPVFVF